MLTMVSAAIANLKDLKYYFLVGFFALFGVWSINNYIENKNLKRENTELLIAKKSQENVIKINDQSIKSNSKSKKEMQKIEQIIKSINVEYSHDDFLKECDKIFKNFGQ